MMGGTHLSAAAQKAQSKPAAKQTAAEKELARIRAEASREKGRAWRKPGSSARATR